VRARARVRGACVLVLLTSSKFWAWGLSGAARPTVLMALGTYVYPETPPPYDVQFGAWVFCVVCFGIAYSEQLFVGGDH
jgi:hypothetical protein